MRDQWGRKVPPKVPLMFPQCSRMNAMIESCFVYVMAAGKFVKVGIATDVNRRLGNIRGGALDVEIIAKRRMPNRATAVKAEKAIHAALAKYHHRRGWFIVKPSRAKSVMSRHCARVRLAAAREARKPVAGRIKMKEYLEPKLPLAMAGMSALEEWQWRKQQRAAYAVAIERGELQLA